MKKIWISIAENGENGQPCGRATMVSFDETVLLEADSIYDGGEKLSHVVSPKGFARLRLHGLQYYYSASQAWVGNIMWNAYLMDTLTACSLLNDLHRSKKWSFNEIYTEIEDVFERNEPLFHGDFERIFISSLIS